MLDAFQHPQYWQAGIGVHLYSWTCTACKDSLWRTAREARRHEKGSKHGQTVAFLDQKALEQATHSSHRLERVLAVEGPLSALCRDLSARVPSSSLLPPQGIPSNTAPAGNLAHESTAPSQANAFSDAPGSLLDLACDESAMARMADALADYLDDPDAPPPSADFLNHPRIVPPSLPEGHFAGARAIRRPRDDEENVQWYPWPDKVTCVLDILRNLPRSLFSDAQMEIISWGMINLGVDDLPSISGLKDTVDALQQRYGIRTTRYSGALGHVYYVNSLADQIAQEFSNPRIAPHIRVYPEDSGKKLEEAWQAERWRKELDATLTLKLSRPSECGCILADGGSEGLHRCGTLPTRSRRFHIPYAL